MALRMLLGGLLLLTAIPPNGADERKAPSLEDDAKVLAGKWESKPKGAGTVVLQSSGRHHGRPHAPPTASASADTPHPDHAIGSTDHREISQPSLARRSHDFANLRGLVGLLAALGAAAMLAVLLVVGRRRRSLLAPSAGHRGLWQTADVSTSPAVSWPSRVPLECCAETPGH